MGNKKASRQDSHKEKHNQTKVKTDIQLNKNRTTGNQAKGPNNERDKPKQTTETHQKREHIQTGLTVRTLVRQEKEKMFAEKENVTEDCEC